MCPQLLDNLLSNLVNGGRMKKYIIIMEINEETDFW
jgi:hypothetical protein